MYALERAVIDDRPAISRSSVASFLADVHRREYQRKYPRVRSSPCSPLGSNQAEEAQAGDLLSSSRILHISSNKRTNAGSWNRVVFAFEWNKARSGRPHRGCQPAGLVAVRETGLMWANMLRAFQVGKALTSDGGPSSWMRPSRVAWAQVSWPACHLTKASASAVM